MNMQTAQPVSPTRDEAERALATLRAWSETATPDERAALEASDPSRRYPSGFVADAGYVATLPDMQNAPVATIRGAAVAIRHVGIAGFRMPLAQPLRDGGRITLDTGITGTVGLPATARGINMSRVMRSFYACAETHAGSALADAALDAYRADLGAADARIQMAYALPLQVRALRSGLTGWQFYDVALETVDRDGARHRMLHLDYVYSSTCPCSLELSEHARRTRGQLAAPHSQRSVARVSVVTGGRLPAEDLIDICRAALPTETQTMVKREDEQAFAELNAAHPVFVEDAVRLLHAGLAADPRIGDFRVVARHAESLHSHDAVAVAVKGATFDGLSVEPRLFGTLSAAV